MKLEKYVDKNIKRRKVILITISAIVLISISFLLYKTFASFTESAEFPMMKGKVDYFGNSDIYFVFYQGVKQLEEMPQKDNSEGLVFDHGECDNGASIEWNSEEWGPIVKNLNKSKTKCSLYFEKKEYVELNKDIPLVESGDGLYKVEHNDLTELDSVWNKTEYRYAGENPDNYVLFNDEFWRIVGLVNVKTKNGIEQRVKIIRIDYEEYQPNFGLYAWDKYTEAEDYTNNWATSGLKDMLNGIYYNSESGNCYIGEYYDETSHLSTCDFTGNGETPKGLNKIARNMVDKDVIWNLGGWDTSEITTSQFYEKERGLVVNGTNPSEWSEETDVGGKHNGIGLIYPSDYGYAVGGNNRNQCLSNNLNPDEDDCYQDNWLDNYQAYLFLTTNLDSGQFDAVFSSWGTGTINGGFPTFVSFHVFPALYLKPSVKIIPPPDCGTICGSLFYPFILE